MHGHEDVAGQTRILLINLLICFLGHYASNREMIVVVQQRSGLHCLPRMQLVEDDTVSAVTTLANQSVHLLVSGLKPQLGQY